MILEIEYYKYDTYLFGKVNSFHELQVQLGDIENRYDPENDNFIALLCRTYNWTVVEGSYLPDCVYDRDARRLDLRR